MTVPNLFSFATSELSQDAFLCWFISWAAPEHRNDDSALNSCARDFINMLFSRSGRPIPSSIKTISIRRQLLHTDIVVDINNEHCILIEDKVHSGIHSDQLARYKKDLQEEFKGERTITPIYLKTGYFEHNDEAQADGYTVILRKDLLKIIQQGYDSGISNAIFTCFYYHLQEIEDALHRYLTVPVDNWKQPAWMGFFQYIQSQLDDEALKYFGWNYVPNPSGGFMGCWCASESAEEEQLPYWQIEQDKLCIKIIVDEGGMRTKRRSFWHNHVVNKAKELGAEFIKPTRFGHGLYMTVAVRKDSYLAQEADGTINLAETMTNIQEAQAILASLLEEKSYLSMP